ncbi:GntR family transcriptional regulator [Microbacterium stercoris]|uniref:GntR family transcriptional regulator n=1 Tax=Microbacterium stercoris TaxID=2820289 RepID=A0A939TMU4_9MICO|nr:GntR family transcriptional regulator [Microbacterium stercoris]MBO3663553.1 GntR family transcriptional regulator [Microbacterium stercoris]
MRFTAIAEALAQRIASGEYGHGTSLPSETRLATEFGVARGTVRRALEQIEADGLVMHHGARWRACHGGHHQQSLDELRSFGQWALSTGMHPAGRTVELSRGRATRLEAHELGLRPRTTVLRIIRVMSLEERPVMIKRTTYPEWLADIISAIPPDARSIMEVVQGVHGVALGHAEHHISAVPASSQDGALLRIPRAAPLLRVVRTARAADGRAFEHSDDRYVADAITLSVVNTSTRAEAPSARGTRVI